MVVSVLTTVAAVLALLASSVAAEQMDTVSTNALRAVEDGVAAGGTDMQNRLPAGMKRYTGVGGDIPHYCIIYTESWDVLAAGDTNHNDKRDSSSGFVCAVEDDNFVTTFRVTKGQEKGGFTLQSIANDMDQINDHYAWGVGWFLAVHDYYRSDTKFPGYVRAMLHADEKKAAVWELEVLPGKHPEYDYFAYGLKLVANRGWSAAYTEGWYLTVPPGSKRDGSSNYVAVTKDLSKATPVLLLPQ